MKITFNELVDSFEMMMDEELNDEKAPKTVAHYKYVLGELKLFFKEDEIITKARLIDYKNNLIEHYKPSTVNNYIIIVNKLIKYIQYRRNNPNGQFREVRNFRTDSTLKYLKVQKKASLEEVLEPSELNRMLRVAKVSDYDLYLIMKIFAYTGIRAEELKYFTIENIKSNYIQVHNKGKTRSIILRNDLKKELTLYAKEKHIESGYLFPGKKKGKMLHQSTIFKRLKRLAGRCRGINIAKVHPHSFRHLFAVKFLESGGDITELADILGHSNINTTAIYTRTTDFMKKKKLENLKY